MLPDSPYDVLVQALRDRGAQDRQAREKCQRWYRQHVKNESCLAHDTSDASSPLRLHRFRTKVPCRMTPAARALLDRLRRQFPGSAVTFQRKRGGTLAVMLTAGEGTEPRQIGTVEQAADTDYTRCNVRDQGLTVDTYGGRLVLTFRYPQTAVRMALPLADGRTRVNFTEIRPALDTRPTERTSSPRVVWMTSPEAETIEALQNRDYEAFYVRFKLEVLAGIWSALSALLSAPGRAQLHRGSHYTLVRETDAAIGRIHQRTVDDAGRAVDIGQNVTYDALPAADLLLLYLDADLLADIAEIYFALQGLGSTDASALRDEFFSIVRRFWAGSHSLTSRYYGVHLAPIVRMSQRVVPMPTQERLLRQDWTQLRQLLIDRYGRGGRHASTVTVRDVHRARGAGSTWQFSTSAAGDVNFGLRLVYRQEWKHLGNRTLDPIVDRAAIDIVQTTKWPVDCDGGINIGARGLAATTEMGLEWECRESSRDSSARLNDIVRRIASGARETATDAAERESESLVAATNIVRNETAASAPRQPYHFDVLTRVAEVENVVFVAERLPSPAEIGLSWVRQHRWILATALLDESFRHTLDTIGQEACAVPLSGTDSDGCAPPDLSTVREQLYDHLRANILHYQRAIWRQEDGQQRSARYRKAGRRVPLDWRFELAAGGALTIDELADRLARNNVDGQFATYSDGRDVELEQIIDPASPLGYYGNYAVYRMRPEFGTGDLFAMLHFFKSPYLRPNAQTRAAEVADPEEIRIADDPGAMRGFQRERSRRVTLYADTGVLGLSDADDAATTDGSRTGIVHSISPVACELTLERARTEVLTLTRGDAIEVQRWLGPAAASGSAALVAGPGGLVKRTSDADAGLLVRTRALEGQDLSLVLRGVRVQSASVSVSGEREVQWALVQRAGEGSAALVVGGSSASHQTNTPASIPTIKPRGDATRTRRLHVGTVRAAVASVNPHTEGKQTEKLYAGAGVALTEERLIVTRHDSRLRPSPVAR